MPRSSKPGRAASRRRPEAPRELPAEALRWTCPPEKKALSPASRDLSLIGIIGQERAIRALTLGIRLYAPGYNVFVRGITGTGRTTTVTRILKRIRGYCPLPPDRCYVHNFIRPDEPRLLSLPRGSGERFRADMETLVRKIGTELAALLESEGHTRRREKIVSRYDAEGDRMLEGFESAAENKGFALKRVRDGEVSRPELFPIIDGQAMPIAEMQKLVAEGKITSGKADTLARSYERLRQDLDGVARQSRELLARMEAEIVEMEKKQIRSALEERIGAIVPRYPPEARKEIEPYLRDIVAALVDNTRLFRHSPLPSEAAAAAALGDGGLALARGRAEEGRRLFGLFGVNVIFDSRRHGDCPVIEERHPTYRRLFGYFERRMDRSGTWTSDYTDIRAGTLLAADGGYLVLTAEDLFAENEVWKALKRTLVSGSLAIMEEGSGPTVPAVALRPQPIPIDLKVIMIGRRESYEALLEREPDFRKIFKVLADFDHEMDLTAKTLRQYGAFIRRICEDEKLAVLEPAAVAAVAEFGARRAGHQGKLSTRFGEIADLLREADYWRAQDGDGRRILARHVHTAVREARARWSLPEEKRRETIRTGQIHIDVRGERIGQANALVIHRADGNVFGMPVRLTATVSPGTAGIVSIEREALMSGPSHTKGVLIISGFLREMFGGGKPITLTASLAFEQSYSGIDGDSASSTEVYALLSALSGLAIRQGIAVTGSVDQKGEIQPVGGINEKIEGFYRICRLKGLDGKQGVMVPEANLRDLMLDDEVISAVREGRFHVWPVRTIMDGIGLLTGTQAGRADAAGCYPEGTVFRLVDDRLARFNETVRHFTPP